MKFVIPLVVVGIAGLILLACRGKRNATDEIQVGGLYASKQQDGSYRVTKVLAVDEIAVHVRIYRNKFKELPKNLDSSVLSLGKIGDPEGFGIGHAPMQREGWLEARTLLKVESVNEDELEGYRIYLESTK